MRAVILMTTGHKYVVETPAINRLCAELATEDFYTVHSIGEYDGKPDFAINTLQVASVFQAHERD